jgi:hypothetical protein
MRRPSCDCAGSNRRYRRQTVNYRCPPATLLPHLAIHDYAL